MTLLMLIVLVLVNAFYVFVEKKTIFNAANITIGIYVIIALINNYFGVKIGFFEVDKNNILLLLCVYLYAVVITRLRDKYIFRIASVKDEKSNLNELIISSLESVKTYKKIVLFFTFTCILRALQINSIIKLREVNVLGRELGLGGLPSHLFLMAYPLASFLFYYGIKKKKISALLLYLIGLAISFASLVKYHAIFYLVITFVFCIFEDRKMGKQLAIFFGIGIVFLFVGNYVVVFASSGVTSYSISDYLFRMWDYVAGSIINGNHCLRLGKYNMEYTPKDLIEGSIFPLINMVGVELGLMKFDIKPFPLGFTVVSHKMSTSNVAGLIYNITYTGSFLLLFVYVTIMIWTTQSAIKKIMSNNDNKYFYCMYITVNMMCFFANYYGLSTIWELLVWSYITPKILSSKWMVN